MAKQDLVWTALPNGYTDDGKSLRVSLLLSPRLDAQNNPEQLGSFPDFHSDTGDWPATLADTSFIVHFGTKSVTIAANDISSPSRVDDRLGMPDSSVWRALFTAETFVRGFGFSDYSNKKVLSYHASDFDGLVKNLYSRLAVSAQDQLPTVSAILSDPAWSELVNALARNDERFTNFDTGLRDPHQQFRFFANEGFNGLKGIAADLAAFQLFHTPPSTPHIDKYAVPIDDPKARAQWLGYKRTKLPKPDDFADEIDFHQIVAAMNQYPTLLRRLGLVVDLLIARDAFNASPGAHLWVDLQPHPGSLPVDGATRTRARLDATRFEAVVRPNPGQGDYRVARGLLNLDPNLFDLLQADSDGSGQKLMSFGRSLMRLSQSQDAQVDPVSKQKREAGAPALRNAGLMLVHRDRASMLKNNFDRQKKLNAMAEMIQGGANPPPNQVAELFSEDLVRGYRIDIWDEKMGLWRSLCGRQATYDINDGEVIITVPEEEGTVRLAATKSADPTSNPDLVWLHEALVSWTGWSLCAPQPGKTIHHKRDADPDKDHVDEVGDAEPDVPPGIRLRTAFKTLPPPQPGTQSPGSLPRLRYGRRYWIRARAVDLTGNSLPMSLDDFGPEKPKKNARTYFRFEPISAPAIALAKHAPNKLEKPAEGESMERIGIRSFNDTPAQNTVPTTQKAHRFAVPPRTNVKEAEYHGMLDRNGIVDPAFFGILAAKDESLGEEKILTAAPLTGGDPVEVGYAVMQDGDELPYLPDPLAIQIAARIFNHPNYNPNSIIKIPFYPTGADWPDAVPFKIELYEKDSDKPHFDKASRTLFVPLPKAVRATLRLSVMPSEDALQLLGVWNWLTPAQQQKSVNLNGQKTTLKKMALQGQHWMVTPWRNVELVHAVQRPLITPEVMKVLVDRPFAATFALPNFVSPCSIKSTDHLDLLATWNEPDGDSTGKIGGNRSRNDHAFAIKITDAQSYAGTPDYQLVGTDLIRAGGVFHDLVQKKIHEFNDTRYRRIEYWLEATTKFREFMPAKLLTHDVNGQTESTDEHIKVTGPTARTWIPSSAPPPAPEVLYVVPTFGWVRSTEKSSSWRRGGGLRVYLNRPWNASGYGEMLAVVLPSASFVGDPSSDPTTQPLKNFVTQWGNDPIWLSPFVAGAAPKRGNFPLGRFAPDPTGAWLPAFASPDESDQPPGQFTTTGLQHPELTSFTSKSFVEIAPHDVFYDDERQLWYCDIQVTWGAAYYPFIRLALARYQPISVYGAHLSNIVLADFMPLVPDRWLTVGQTKDSRTHRVSVFGSTYTDSSSHVEAKNAPAKSIRLRDGTIINVQAPDVALSSVIEIWVEHFDPSFGEDFGWRREPDAIVQRDVRHVKKRPTRTVLAKQRARAKQLLKRQKFDLLLKENLINAIFITPTLWEGSVTVPQTPGVDARYRLVIAEYEEYLIDDATPYDPIPTKKDRRLVFLEYVELT